MTRHYCSRACWRASLNQTRRGEANPNWNGGRYVNPDGYVEVRVNGKAKLEHRHLMEQHIGRPLKEWELVHHKDGDKTHNVIENLEIHTASSHMRHHNPRGPKRQVRTVACRFCGNQIETRGTAPADRFVCQRPECKKKQADEYQAKYRDGNPRYHKPLVPILCSICGRTFPGKPRMGAKSRTCGKTCYYEYQRRYAMACRARTADA